MRSLRPRRGGQRPAGRPRRCDRPATGTARGRAGGRSLTVPRHPVDQGEPEHQAPRPTGGRRARAHPRLAGRAPTQPEPALYPPTPRPHRHLGRAARRPRTHPRLAGARTRGQAGRARQCRPPAPELVPAPTRPPTGRHHPASADRDLRRRVSAALDFLAWIDQRDLAALTDLTQEHIDDWIAGAVSQRRYLVRYFLKWTTSRRLTLGLAVPSIPRQEPQGLLDEDDRWPLLQRCLTDAALPTDVRAAGAITLLFGPSTERLCHLTPEHLKFGDKHAHLVLGRHPFLLPPRLAELLRRLAEQPQLRPQLSRAHPGPRWLFPGMLPGKPISTHGMTQKLGRHGIPEKAISV